MGRAGTPPRGHRRNRRGNACRIEAALVDQAEALAAADDFDGAVALIRGLPATSAAKASSKYRAVVNSWADAQFQRVESVSDRATQQALLQRVVDFIDVDPNRRARAQAQIDTLNRPPEPDTSESPTTDVTPTSNSGASVPPREHRTPRDECAVAATG